MSGIDDDVSDVSGRMHDAISSLVRASAQNDLILDQLFERVVALEKAHVRREIEGEPGQ